MAVDRLSRRKMDKQARLKSQGPSSDSGVRKGTGHAVLDRPREQSGGQVGNAFNRAAFASHARLLSGSANSTPGHATQRADIVRRLQSSYGNKYVQRIVDDITASRSEDVQRATLPNSQALKTMIQGAGELVYHYNETELHQKSRCAKQLSLYGSFASILESPEEKSFGARIAGALINYKEEVQDHARAVSHLQNIADIVYEGMSQISDKNFTSSLDSWVPKRVAKLPESPKLLASLTPSAATSESLTDNRGMEGDTDDEPVYANDPNFADDTDEVIYSNVGAEAENPYGVAIPAGPQEQESPYEKTPGWVKGGTPAEEPTYAKTPGSVPEMGSSRKKEEEENPYGVKIYLRRKALERRKSGR